MIGSAAIQTSRRETEGGAMRERIIQGLAPVRRRQLGQRVARGAVLGLLVELAGRDRPGRPALAGAGAGIAGGGVGDPAGRPGARGPDRAGAPGPLACGGRGRRCERVDSRTAPPPRSNSSNGRRPRPCTSSRSTTPRGISTSSSPARWPRSACPAPCPTRWPRWPSPWPSSPGPRGCTRSGPAPRPACPRSWSRPS